MDENFIRSLNLINQLLIEYEQSRDVRILNYIQIVKEGIAELLIKMEF